ncbi:MAG: hypothetical protein FD168_900 [Desulfobulbaceae bacterium]|nr:MAG: hypothetical protein FD168_900 [Desulfobulbaceae bacterium]
MSMYVPSVSRISPRRLAVLLTAALLLFGTAGCYNTPVRHLAGDIILIKAGETTREEAKAIMGEPDSTRQVSATVEEWIYQEEDKSMWQKTPVVGDSFSAKGYKTVALMLEGNVVTAARYGTYVKDELAWKEDCKWQKIEDKPQVKDDSK